MGNEIAQNSNIEEILHKVDKDSNTRIFTGWPKIIISVLMIAAAVYVLFLTLFFTGATPQTKKTTFVALIVLLGYLVYPAYKNQTKKINYIPWYDIVLSIVGSASIFFYSVTQTKVIEMDAAKMPVIYVVAAIVGILCIVELCRRAVGLPIIFVVGAFAVYLFVYYAQNPRLKFDIILKEGIYNLFYNINDSVFGTPINACVSFIVLFIMMGAFLEKTGIAAFFIDLANSIAGASCGGPAKVAVISSALEGMISGSSVANTVGSGSVTIPVMKQAGYKPEFAAAVEAAASTGGQIMPPIMGAAAFLMAEITDIRYSVIVLSAILPAILYFAGIFLMVHFEAKKNGLQGLPKDAIPNFFKLIVRKGYLLTPIVILVISMNHYSAGLSACIAILASMVIGLLPENISAKYLSDLAKSSKFKLVMTFVLPLIPVVSYFLISSIMGENHITTAVLVSMVLVLIISFFSKESSLKPAAIANAFETSAKNSISVGIACAMAGMIAAVVTATSLASKITPLISNLADINIFLALFATMICCIILGMGVPTTANYVIMGSTIAPILVGLGIPPLAAHMFVFYFGIVADITPPVALAAYAGAAIAKSDPIKTGVNATKLAIAAFIVPYIFTLDTKATLLIGYTEAGVLAIIFAIITSIIGMFAISSGMQGYCLSKLSWWQRILLLGFGLCLIYPETISDIIGFVGVALIVIMSFLKSKKDNKVTA